MTMGSVVLHVSRVLHAISLYLVGAAALVALAVTTLAAFGVIPWLQISAQFGETVLPQAGMTLQIALTVLLVVMAAYLPANTRILDLENSHRNFRISMDDVARAYYRAHAADRTGLFTMSREFDAVRERLEHLRDHPDLEEMQAGAMTIAAQMSQQARHLADGYNDEKVARAKEFLARRQEQAALQQERIVEALQVCRQIRRWVDEIEVEEAIVASQLQQLDEQLQTVLPTLGYGFEGVDPVQELVPAAAPAAQPARSDNVIALQHQKTAAE